MANFEPKPFGKYFLTERLAVGGMAEIYKAKTFGVDGFEKILAIKKILSHYSSDKEFITMLTDEAKLVVNLSHANIVQVYDLGRVGDDYFISMECIDGINLREFIERGQELGKQIPTDVCIYIAAEICKGLDYAHNKKDAKGKPLKIVHRDISPQNILVSHEGGVKIVDFGIAKAAMNLSQTNIGILKGKVTYMAPEQAFGKPIDSRADLFSVGIVFHELLTYKRLFRGESQMEILKKIRNTKISEESLGENVPVALRPIIAKALAYSVKERYQSAADLQIDLTRTLYTNYPDFTPRKLSVLLHDWFHNKQVHKEFESNVPDEELLVSATPLSQVNLVHRDESQIFIETVKPDDQIMPNDFASQSDEEQSERTEKSEITSPSLKSIDQMVFGKRVRRQKVRIAILAGVFTVLLFVVWSLFLDNNKNGTSKTGQDTVEQVAKPQVVLKNLLLDSTPSESDVRVDGVLQKEKTPILLKGLVVGKKYSMSLLKTGFAEASRVYTPTLQGEQTLLVPLTANEPESFKLVLSSIPLGASVVVDGAQTGKVTPTEMDNLVAGKNYKLSLKLSQHRDFEQDFVSEHGRDQSLEIKLAPADNPKMILTSTPVGAAIFVDGKDSGFVTPHEFLDFFVGQKLVFVVKLVGFDDVEQQITLDEIKDYNLQMALVAKKTEPVLPPMPVVQVTTNLPGVDVFVDGVKKGVSPLSVPVGAGKHTITVKKSGYKDQSKRLTIVASDESKVAYFNLMPLTSVTATAAADKSTKLTSKGDGEFGHSKSSTAALAKLRIDSTPRGASVRIDGKPRGVTPIVVSDLAKGKNLSISVSKSGYQNWSRTVSLSKDWTEMAAVLAP